MTTYSNYSWEHFLSYYVLFVIPKIYTLISYAGASHKSLIYIANMNYFDWSINYPGSYENKVSKYVEKFTSVVIAIVLALTYPIISLMVYAPSKIIIAKDMNPPTVL